MMRTPPFFLLLSSLLGACGMAAEGNQDIPDGSTGAPCEVMLSFQPATPRVDTAVVATATLDSNDLPGIHTFEWSVFFDGAELPVAPSSPDVPQLSFTPTSPGPYRVIAHGQVGYVECLPDEQTINVIDGPTATYRLRFHPRPEHGAPVQERPVTLVSGTDFDLGDTQLDSGIPVSGTVQDGAGTPVGAYVRAMPLVAGTPPFAEAFASAEGAFTMRLAPLVYYDVLVVPDDGIHAPALFRERQIATGQSATGETSGTLSLVLPSVTEIAGTVTRGAGAPLAGARVSVRAGQVFSTLGRTNGTGAFALRMHLTGSGAPSITVAPPEPSPLPLLEVPSSDALLAALQPGDVPALAIAYDPGLEDTRTVAPAATLADGSTPAPGARAPWIGRPMPGAGAVTPTGSAPLQATGTLRRVVTADADGAFPALALPAAVYDVILEPPPGAGGTTTLVEVDLAQGSPDPLALAAPATLQGRVTDSAGSDLDQVRVIARPTGLLANSAAARRTTTTSADGRFTLPVTAGGTYDLVLDGPDRARVHTPVTAPAPGQSTDLGALVLPGTHQVTGRVTISGVAGGAAGVTLQLLCLDCSGPGSTEPIAEAITDATGRFVLAVPAPQDAPQDAGGAGGLPGTVANLSAPGD